ncbi:lipoate--protein ligase family protein [Arthrobacter agilis]|uniref:lipoate--protein ligase family protein n=1 Tax=Arthrobacter agilis TaxID=37921 RepID=UPI0027820BAB|nr:biotin/lipoate A/B protein ligase family protein [Arthrobacter agilis]MDQ0734639.1 lipoate-protein ligase A [Arthrobacter agilis]
MTSASASASDTARLHGEFKTPGGKLTAVDLTVRDGRLADVSVNGDFFLEPDEALLDINAALEGLPADTAPGELAAAVTARLDPSAVLFGFSAEAIATAVRRALGRATSFADHTWEIIPPTPLSTAMHVAMDEVLTHDVGTGARNPTLRFWEWQSPSVVIGSFQSMRNEVDPDGAVRHGVTVVRRISGGGAMFMEHGNAITYSIYVPQSLVDGMSFADSYPFLDAWVMEALQELGITAWYQPLNDIATELGKIGGAAQKRLANGGMLHHVTMSYDIDADKMLEVLRIGKEKMSDKGTKSAKKRVDPLRRQTGRTREEIIDVLMSTFRRRYGAVDATLSEAELRRAEQLVAEKFGTEDWLYRVP